MSQHEPQCLPPLPEVTTRMGVGEHGSWAAASDPGSRRVRAERSVWFPCPGNGRLAIEEGWPRADRAVTPRRLRGLVCEPVT